ncbi:conserved repeat domain protein [Leucobacter sp. 7(1)]|nr:conserved repeat domain protein [Leucobacter sp. 7(1)]
MAIDRGVGEPLTEVAAGESFQLSANVGCPDPSGCGPAELQIGFPEHIEFLDKGIVAPPGASFVVTPAESGTGQVVTLTWESLDGTAVVFLPAAVPRITDAGADGTLATVTGTLSAGVGDDAVVITGAADMTLRVPEVPGVSGATHRWAEESVQEGSATDTSHTLTAIADANSTSTLTFRVPGDPSVPAAALPAAEAFDLVQLELNQNPGGATITFTLANGSTHDATLQPGDLTLVAPADAVAVELVATGLPSRALADPAARTVTMTAHSTLRTTQRTSGDRIIASPSTSRTVRATGHVVNAVSAPAAGESPIAEQRTLADVRVSTVPPALGHSLTWLTASGDSTSVYGSQEASAATIRLANTGLQELSEVSVRVDARSGDFFEYQRLTEVPAVTFPPGADRATIQYTVHTEDGPEQGTAREFGPFDAVPGPDVGEQDLAAVGAVSIVFSSSGGIPGGCELAAECAGAVVLQGALRETRLSNGAEITPPPQNPGTTPLSMTAAVGLRATTGTEASTSTQTAQLTIVKPQFTTTLTKRFGDGGSQTVYPPTGTAAAGDIYVPGREEQIYADHPLRFTVETQVNAGENEPQGATGFTIVDPQLEPSPSNLPENPFNTIRVTTLTPIAQAQAVCVADDESAVGSETVREFWVVDDLTDPQHIEFVDDVDPDELDRIVGFQLRVTPTAQSGEFPRAVRCEVPAGMTAGFRDAQVADMTHISPANLAPAETPGLLTVTNTAEVWTGTNLPTAVGSDRLTLLEEQRSAVAKAFAPEAPSHGIAGRNTRTGFTLAGVPDGQDSVATRIVDGGRIGDSLDIFALAKIRDARLGPDQILRLSFRDLNGAAIGPIGTVDPGTSLPTGPLSDAEIENSQSAGYREFREITRELEWNGEWAAGERERVFEVRATLQRSDPDQALQTFGAFSVILDATLRTTRLSDQDHEITGSPEGTRYTNVARISSRAVPLVDPDNEDDGQWTARPEGTAAFTVFAATEITGDGRVSWDAADGDGYLVAKHGTESHVTLEASNRTVVGPSGSAGAPGDLEGSVPIGIEQLTASVGGDAESGSNPFAILDFTGVSELSWPLSEDAPIWGSESMRRVAGTLSYTFADGSIEELQAPVGAEYSELNPKEERWGDIVGVAITWAEPHKFVGARLSASETPGRLGFTAALRDFVRADFTYDFTAGDPAQLGPGASIEGGFPSDEGLIQRRAALAAEYRGGLTPLEDFSGTLVSEELPINSAAPGVAATLSPTRNGVVDRDIASGTGQDTSWELRARNTGNFPVGVVRLASESGLLAGAWDGIATGSGAPAPGTLLDTSRIVQASVVYPKGATAAEIRVRDASGAWTAPIPAENGSAIALPPGGTGPQRWEDATGIRVEFAAEPGADQLIEKRSEAILRLTTRLRETLRSDTTELAPATLLPEGKQSWESQVTGAAAVHSSSQTGALATASNVSAALTVRPGTPAPRALKFAARYDANANTGLTNTQANPGSWVNFTLVLENRGSASSNLYGLRMEDVLPPELHYNATSAAYAWRVESAPEGVSTSPDVEIINNGSTSLRWTWPEHEVLRPGERIVLRLPLQLSDGLPASQTTLNTVRVIGSGIPDAPGPSVCAADDANAQVCTAQAGVEAQRIDSVRLESYLDAKVGGASVLGGESCDITTVADWDDGTWVRNPCLVETTVDGGLTYRVKVINSGNSALTDLRFVNELPKIGDKGTVLQSPRGSEWTPGFVPGSARLLTGEAATNLGARGDGELRGDTFRYSATAKPCTLIPDGYSTMTTMDCDAGDWSAVPSATSAAFGGDISFVNGTIGGGEYVLIDFDMSVPATGIAPSLSWNSAAGTGRTHPTTIWQPTSESPKSGARAQDTDMFVTVALGEGAATPWHLAAQNYEVTIACLNPGASIPSERVVTLPGIDTPQGTRTARVAGLPRGGSCEVSDQRYEPSPAAGPGQYGLASESPTGYRFTAAPAEPIVLKDDPAANNILVVTEFVETELQVGVDVAGEAADLISQDASFEVAVVCEFGGVTQDYGPFSILRGETETITGLPVGVSCTATERDHRGAAQVTASVNGSQAVLDEQRGVRVSTLDPGKHEIRFTNTFAAGGDLTILKTAELPRAGLAVGDVAFGLSCDLGGYTLDLGDRGTLGLSFAPGEARASGSIRQLPVGAECTVRETEAGGAHVPAPDRTVTVLPQDEVIVEMVNTVHPAALELSKEVAGPGAAEDRVPDTFGIQSTCTRELTIDGVERTVTDHDGLSRVAPGAPATIAELPAGAQCAVTEPDPAGAERTTVVPLGEQPVDVADQPEESALVTLTGPGPEATAVPTEVRVTNFYTSTTGLSVTGAVPMGWTAVVALLLLSGGLFVTLRRRARG